MVKSPEELAKFDAVQIKYFEATVAQTLKQGNLSPEAVTLIPKYLSKTFLEAKNQLGIKYPIIARPSDLILDSAVIRAQDPNTIRMAHFIPTIVENRVVQGELVLDRHVLIAYARIATWKGNKPFTPWKLMADVTHELKHGKQYQDDLAWVRLDQQQYPYKARVTEQQADEYALACIRGVQPQGILDRVERAFVILDLRRDIKRNIEARKELKLD